MTITKLKMMAALVLVVGILASATGLLAKQVRAEAETASPMAEAPDQPKSNAVPRLRKDRNGDDLPPGALARFGTVRFRHGNAIKGLSLSPDGRTLATAGGHGFIRLWDAATGKELRSLHREDPYTTSKMAVFSPDGRTIATAGQTGVSLWQADNGKWLRDLGRSDVSSLAFAPDGKTLAVLDWQKGPSLWDVASGKGIAELRRRDTRPDDVQNLPVCHSVTFSPDGRLLASTYEDCFILWDMATRKEVRRLEGHKPFACTAAFSPDGKVLVCGSGKGTIHLWDPTNGKHLRPLKGHKDSVACLVFTPDGKTLVSGSDGRYQDLMKERRGLRLWDVASGEERGAMGEHGSGVASLALSRDGTLLFAAEGGSVRLWDMGTRQEVRPRDGHQNWIASVAFTPDGKRLLTGGDRTIRLWDAATARTLRTFDVAVEVNSVVLSPDGRTIASASRDGVLRLLDASSGREVRHFDADQGGHICLAFSPDGRHLALASRGKTAALWDVATGEELRRFKGPDEELTYQAFICVAFSPDGKRIATGELVYRGDFLQKGKEVTPLVRVWDTTTGKQIHALQGHQNIIIHGVAFSPDGTMLASTGWDKTTRLWDAVTGQALGQLPAGTQSGESVAFSPDGRTLATGGFDDTVYLCEVATRKERARFAGHRAFIHGLAFSPDGRTLVSGSMDSTVLLWDVRRPARPADREKCWQALADADAAKAYQAINELATAPELAVPLLRERVPAVRPPDPQHLTRLLAELDDDRFETRDNAMKQIEKIGELAGSALRKTLAGKPSLEVRRRLEQLLAAIEPTRSSEQLRALRAVEVLEYIGTLEARRVLETLARGAAEARLTREAKASLARLTRRSSP